ncbi:MAG: YraN family protein [Clostridia bacterium]|jgi:putative endonuclease|nr:YraN family protein [Clostridia bacterium]NLS84117.1 YraN family protein [Oscillospiraceae bacterium]
MIFSKLLGDSGEKLAAKYYEKQGYEIVARNYRTRMGEIDIIVKTDDILVFVEVKTRSENTIASPREFVTKQKQRRIIAAAKAYMSENKCEPIMRFDVVEIINRQVNCIENAFTL